jgi:cell division protein FtsB
MRNKFALLGVLFLVVAFVILNIFTDGVQHVEVVDENIVLVGENGKLKAENGKLRAENGQLKSLANQLTKEKNTLLTSAMDSAKKQLSVFPKALVKVEQEIDAQLGWASPEMTSQLLEEKLKRKPDEEEYRRALTDLYNKDMLYYPDYPDPYVKGKRVTKSEIAKLKPNN